MKSLMNLLTLALFLQVTVSSVQAARYDAAQNYLNHKLSNPRISDQAKKKILNQALKNSVREINHLSGYERYTAEQAWKTIKYLGENSRWNAIVVMVNQLSSFK